jgi:hypothetical protein
MLNRIAFSLLVSLLFTPVLALAEPHDHAGHAQMAVVHGSPAEMAKRIEELEKNQAELYHTLAEKKTAGLAGKITDRITLSGLLEVEASAAHVDFRDHGSDAASDLVLATAQLGFGIRFIEQVSGDLILLYEEDATDLEVDEAAINLSQGPWSARIGRQYLPFGVFHSHFISDPLTLELGETRETALLVGYTRGSATLSTFVFNGDTEKSNNEDHLRDWGINLTLAPLEGVEVGGSYLSDLADTDAGLLAVPEYRRRVAGWSVFAVAEQGPFGVTAEVLGAVQSFAAEDLDEDQNGRGDKPLAWNLEASWTPLENVELALRYEGSRDFAGQPKQQYGVDVSWSPWENTTLSLEYLRGSFDRDFAGDLTSAEGSAADRRDLFTAQLAFEF